MDKPNLERGNTNAGVHYICFPKYNGFLRGGSLEEWKVRVRIWEEIKFTFHHHT